MIRRYLLLYFVCLSIPLCLGASVWQSLRYTKLERDLRTLEADQGRWVESNRQLIAGVAYYSSPEQIAVSARKDPGLLKIVPEYVLQIRINGRAGSGR